VSSRSDAPGRGRAFSGSVVASVASIVGAHVTGCVTGTSTAGSHSDIARHLRKSQLALRSLRWQIGCFWATVAVVFGVLFDFFFLQAELQAVPMADFLSSALFNGRLFLFSLAPLADDVIFSRVVLGLDVIFVIPPHMQLYKQYGLGSHHEESAVLAVMYARATLFAASAIWAAWPTKPWCVQRRMWNMITCYVVLSILENVCWLSYIIVVHNDLHHKVAPKHGEVWQLLADVMLLYITLRPELRQFLQRRLWKLLERRATLQGAASIACIIGQCNPSEIVAQAKSRFRAVSVDQITFEVMADNKPNPAYSALSESCSLGGCDAFLSHSWHDDAQAKWVALQRWRQNFLEIHGREPHVWLDKCCIDQNNIDVDLRCLPVFLKGCKRLVVLCGPTYLSRLWCILELFTYIHMDGDVGAIEVEPLMREGFEQDDADEIHEAFGSFDARSCDCANPAERERMLNIIETAYGSMPQFNGVVQSITDEVYIQVEGRLPTCSASSGSSSELSNEPSQRSRSSIWSTRHFRGRGC